MTHYISNWLGPISTFLGFVAVLLVYYLQSRRALSTQRAEIYADLERESSRLFEIARQNPRMVRYLEGEAPGSPEEERELHHDAFWFLPQVLNLFELSISFRKRGILEPDILVTWVAWYFEVASYERFDDFWKEFRIHYKRDLREILDAAVACAKYKTEGSPCPKQYFERCARILKDATITEYYRALEKDYERTTAA